MILIKIDGGQCRKRDPGELFTMAEDTEHL
jgi:hypothetical protein